MAAKTDQKIQKHCEPQLGLASAVLCGGVSKVDLPVVHHIKTFA
jgi:hypothetical protein